MGVGYIKTYLRPFFPIRDLDGGGLHAHVDLYPSTLEPYHRQESFIFTCDPTLSLADSSREEDPSSSRQ